MRSAAGPELTTRERACRQAQHAAEGWVKVTSIALLGFATFLLILETGPLLAYPEPGRSRWLLARPLAIPLAATMLVLAWEGRRLRAVLWPCVAVLLACAGAWLHLASRPGSSGDVGFTAAFSWTLAVSLFGLKNASRSTPVLRAALVVTFVPCVLLMLLVVLALFLPFPSMPD